jgi:hypothetical protein
MIAPRHACAGAPDRSLRSTKPNAAFHAFEESGAMRRLLTQLLIALGAIAAASSAGA